MSLGLRLNLTVAQAQEQDQLQLCDLDLTGGITQSIFPEVEAFLQAESDHQHAIEWLARKKTNVGKYRSVMDFLFCETFPEWKLRCFRFYLSGKEQLRFQITVAERLYYTWHLLRIVVFAYQAYNEKRQVSWGFVRYLVRSEDSFMKQAG